jgi:Flp pilus assembly protein TadG
MPGGRQGLWNDQQGLAAVEFAFILPIMLTMLLGLVELSQALACRSDVTNMASTGADLISQETSAGGSDLDNVFNALNAMLYPFSTGSATITLTSVIDGGTGNSPKVAWSCTKGGTKETKDSTSLSVPLPAGLITAGGGGSVIWGKITYSYTSPLNYFLHGAQPWVSNFYARPRRVLQIPLSLSGNPTALGTCTS